MHMQPIYRNNDFVTREGNGEAVKLNNISLDIFKRGLCLPSDIKMTEVQQEKVVELIKKCFS